MTWLFAAQRFPLISGQVQLTLITALRVLIIAKMIAPPPQSQSELHLLCVSAIVRDLISTHNSTSHTVVPNVNALRLKYAKKYNLNAVPRLTDVLSAVPEEWKDRLRGWLRAKPVRTASGVAVVAVMCKPHRCPHVAMTGNICV